MEEFRETHKLKCLMDQRGHLCKDDLPAMADAFRRWAATDGATFTVPHGEVLATP